MIDLPSGEKDGQPDRGPEVTWREFSPFASAIQICCCPDLSETNAILLPSGATAAFQAGTLRIRRCAVLQRDLGGPFESCCQLRFSALPSARRRSRC